MIRTGGSKEGRIHLPPAPPWQEPSHLLGRLCYAKIEGRGNVWFSHHSRPLVWCLASEWKGCFLRVVSDPKCPKGIRFPKLGLPDPVRKPTALRILHFPFFMSTIFRVLHMCSFAHSFLFFLCPSCSLFIDLHVHVWALIKHCKKRS